jgi:single-strand DNA-binding protein
MNVVVLIGNLTKDPDVRYTTSNDPLAVARFSIAVNEGYGDKQKTYYPNIVVFGKTAENCEKYLSKGSKVAIKGHIQTGSYEKDGHKVYTTDVVAENVEFLSTSNNSKKEDEVEW